MNDHEEEDVSEDLAEISVDEEHRNTLSDGMVGGYPSTESHSSLDDGWYLWGAKIRDDVVEEDDLIFQRGTTAALIESARKAVESLLQPRAPGKDVDSVDGPDAVVKGPSDCARAESEGRRSGDNEGTSILQTFLEAAQDDLDAGAGA